MTSMEIIASDTDSTIARMLDSYEHPAILVNPDYQILATNNLYLEKFGVIDVSGGAAHCYKVSHDYDRPCDQAGEDCPLMAATRSGQRERVLHIHQTPRGQEHVDVEMLPILDEQGSLKFFVELLKPVPVAGEGGERPMVGASAGFNRMLELVTRVAPTNAAVLLLGESGTYRPVGSTEVKQTDFRLVCATHKNLERMVDAGEFRQDLYYRINVFPIHMPSLAERLEDLPLLARTMLMDKDGNKAYHLTESAVTLLKTHHYRGNIRELRNILSRAMVLTNTNVIDQSVIKQSLDVTAGAVAPSDMSLKAVEQRYLEQLMRTYRDDKEKVAAIAGISIRSLYRKLQEAQRVA